MAFCNIIKAIYVNWRKELTFFPVFKHNMYLSSGHVLSQYNMMFTKIGTILEMYVGKGIHRCMLGRIHKNIRTLNPVDLRHRLITDTG